MARRGTFGKRPGEKVIFMIGKTDETPPRPEVFAIEFDNNGQREISINDARGRFVQFAAEHATDMAFGLLQRGKNLRVDVNIRAPEFCGKCGRKTRDVGIRTGCCEPACKPEKAKKPAPKKKAAPKKRPPRMRAI